MKGIHIGRPTELRNSYFLWTVPADSTVRAKILVDSDHVISGDFCSYAPNGKDEVMWVYTGDDDPCHELNISPRFSIVIPMLVRLGSEKVIKNVRLPRSCDRKIDALIATHGTIHNLIITITRDDSGQWSEYTLLGTARGKDDGTFKQNEWVQSFVDFVVDGNPDDIRAALNITKRDDSIVEEEL